MHVCMCGCAGVGVTIVNTVVIPSQVWSDRDCLAEQLDRAVEYSQLVGGNGQKISSGRLQVFRSARANPGCLDTLSSFHDNFERPILEGQKFDCTKRQLAQGRRSKPLKNDIDYCCTTCVHVCSWHL